jgi:hypothetical protein
VVAVLRNLRKPVIWTGVATLLLVTMYVGAYFRIVRPVNAAYALENERGATQVQIKVSPLYSLPWPIPAHFNQPWLMWRLDAWFAPVHRLDRRLRPNVWHDDRNVWHDERGEKQEATARLTVPTNIL